MVAELLSREPDLFLPAKGNLLDTPLPNGQAPGANARRQYDESDADIGT